MERKNETAIESRSCWATKSRTDFLLLFHLSLFQTRCGSIYRRLHCTDIKMSQLGSALALSELQILTRKCSFHLNNVIKVDLHLKREGRGVEQPRSLRAFSDCNMRFRLGGEMNVNLCVCARRRLNHSITFQPLFDFPRLWCLWQSLSFGELKPSIDLINACHQTVWQKKGELCKLTGMK